jgi:streptomycin 6-kinase
VVIPELTKHVLNAVRGRAKSLGLSPEDVRVEYVLNWGGFVAASFHVTDGRRKLHLKLVRDDDGERAVMRWMNVRTRLETHYNAPRVVGWIAIEASPWRGPVFEHVIAATMNDAIAANVVPRVCEVLKRLHADDDLARRVRHPRSPATLRDAFDGIFRAQYVQDLELIGSRPPPFVTADGMRWMRDEAHRVLSLAMQSSAFDEPAVSPTHGDLWSDNVLVGDDGRFWLIDWDNLDLGDPVRDYATLAWPRISASPAEDWRVLRAFNPDDGAAAQRLEIHLRATMLDWVVDVLADWIDAQAAPEHLAEVRARKFREHSRYLELYRARYA